MSEFENFESPDFATEGKNAMQKWEYMIVGYGPGGNKRGYQAHYINGQELKDWKTMPDMFTHLNQLGEQGWEVVHLEWHNHGARVTFKRPKT